MSGKDEYTTISLHTEDGMLLSDLDFRNGFVGYVYCDLIKGLEVISTARVYIEITKAPTDPTPVLPTEPDEPDVPEL